MNENRAQRYRDAQILCGIRQIWAEQVGCEDPIEPEMRIDEHLKAAGLFDELDFADLFFVIERHFGFHCSREEWLEFCGFEGRNAEEWQRMVGPRFTFAALVRFIAERVDVISFESITILGKPCATAGAFRGIEQLAYQINENVERFGPSTAIRERLRGYKLYQFWQRLRWISAGKLPAPRRIEITKRSLKRAVLFKIALAVFGAALSGAWKSLVPGIFAGFLLIIPYVIAIGFINTRLINPLPSGIKTFGDLARELAEVNLEVQCA